MSDTTKIAILGLGYVGLPLAVEFGKQYSTAGFDIKQSRIEELNLCIDKTQEVSPEELTASPHLSFTFKVEDIEECNVYIVTVPTPVDAYKRPDLRPLRMASRTVGSVLKKGDIVIYESTVFPGCTEEECVPILEQTSGLKFNRDFFCGYSPERINPGDKNNRITSIKKVTSGSTPETAQKVDALYKSIIPAGTHLAESIKEAEAAKVIENAQRDINIAFVNELALIFHKMGIDTLNVLEAAGTKWNFLPFRPGLVGGHCIGVDPYYLTWKAEAVGHHPEIILSGRRINDFMGAYVAGRVVKLMIKHKQPVDGARVLILGMTFKENCPDIRNSRVIDIIEELRDFGCSVSVYDPWADWEQVRQEYGITMLGSLSDAGQAPFNALVAAVAHDQFKKLDPRTLVTPDGVIFDVKGIYDKAQTDGRL
jgi:UDP-N-acetyl-D-galactosamine dehydrogenase